MCDVCVCVGGGGDKQFDNATQQMVRVKGQSQWMLVAMYKYIHTIYTLMGLTGRMIVQQQLLLLLRRDR